MELPLFPLPMFMPRKALIHSWSRAGHGLVHPWIPRRDALLQPRMPPWVRGLVQAWSPGECLVNPNVTMAALRRLPVSIGGCRHTSNS